MPENEEALCIYPSSGDGTAGGRSMEITGNKLVKEVLRSRSRVSDLRTEPKPENAIREAFP